MTVDIHGHITSPKLFERFPMPASLADIDGMIEQKEALGITTTVVGSPVGAGTMVRVPGLDNYRQPLDQLGEFHDWVAEQVRARPGRLKAYAYTNPYGGAAMLDSAAALLEREEFVGLIVNTSVEGRFLDSRDADPFFAMAAERRAPILVHPPAEPAGAAHLRDPRLVEHVARPADIATGVAAIVFAGWLEKYPQLRIIAPTAGGGLPLLVEKLELASRMPPPGGPSREGSGTPGGGRDAEPTTGRAPSASLQQVYVDTATPSRSALSVAVRAFGPHNVVFGTDSPPLTEPLERAIEELGQLGLAPSDEARIKEHNAAELLGLDRSAADGDAATRPLRPDRRTEGGSR